MSFYVLSPYVVFSLDLSYVLSRPLTFCFCPLFLSPCFCPVPFEFSLLSFLSYIVLFCPLLSVMSPCSHPVVFCPSFFLIYNPLDYLVFFWSVSLTPLPSFSVILSCSLQSSPPPSSSFLFFLLCFVSLFLSFPLLICLPPSHLVLFHLFRSSPHFFSAAQLRVLWQLRGDTKAAGPFDSQHAPCLRVLNDRQPRWSLLCQRKGVEDLLTLLGFNTHTQTILWWQLWTHSRLAYYIKAHQCTQVQIKTNALSIWPHQCNTTGVYRAERRHAVLVDINTLWVIKRPQSSFIGATQGKLGVHVCVFMFLCNVRLHACVLLRWHAFTPNSSPCLCSITMTRKPLCIFFLTSLPACLLLVL